MVAFDDLKWATYDLLEFIRLKPVAMDLKEKDEDVDSRRVAAAVRLEGHNFPLMGSFLPAGFF
eukprot:3130701-Pleurochrysis_carterae.AAC.1